jgi:hypothetical protein
MIPIEIMAAIARLSAPPASPSRRLKAAKDWETLDGIMLGPFAPAAAATPQGS